MDRMATSYQAGSALTEVSLLPQLVERLSICLLQSSNCNLLCSN